ncbi:hypothetical protein [Pseudoflavonifractor phocaeensis]|uniref:hypothetical protein n=1 Tax=Pseudoflavonifractor phocaeensis TaxID=1870988 RepID=UPI00195DAF99|nr:hypothetical protein [Pseudoflavonifractor phocaeensis]MBM6869439.1 hypothetical protein [Pseudoflavonifractor phocaeensis]
MDILALIAAFGGGIIGAYMGALPAFILTGVLALAGTAVSIAGGDGSFIINSMAFGSFVGPHIAFAGGVAASAYAGRKGKLTSGADIASPLNGLGAPDVLLVGGVFGVFGYIVATLIGKTPLGPLTDLPGITVVISGIVARLVFGKTGLTGKYTGKGPRTWFSTGTTFVYNVVLGGGIGIAVSFVAAAISKSAPEAWAATISGNFAVMCFGFAAITLIFTQTGSAMPGTHHIMLPSGLAAVVGIAAWGPYGAFLGVVFGILGSLLGDFFGNTFNSHCDSHIDPPAFTIFLLTIVVSLLRIALVG